MNALRAANRLPFAARAVVPNGAKPAALPKGTRGYADGGEAKVDYPWNAPTSPSLWKSEHVVFAVLAGWGLVITGAMKAFGGKKEEKA